MNTQQLTSAIELIRHPERMDRSTIPVLRKAIERYPYYHTLHLLLLQNMYAVHDLEFSKELGVSALCVADRSVLFDMVEGGNFSIPTVMLENPGGVDGDKTLALIDNFLKGVPTPAASQQQAAEAPDSMGDYSLYLEQLPDIGHNEGSAAPTPQTRQDVPETTAADSAPETQPHDNAPEYEEDEEFTVPFINKHLADTTPDETPQTDDAPFAEEHKKEFFTETMASLYIKQHKYEQALEIIESISAENPKKSAYFADQMRYLKLLIRINKNKDNRNV
jgi:hypothetical protein